MAAKIVCLTLMATAWARTHHGPDLPSAVVAFYDALEDPFYDAHPWPARDEALKHFTEDAVWAHTGAKTAYGLVAIKQILKNVAGSKISETTTVDFVSNHHATSVIVTRMWRSTSHDARRESFFLEGGRIKSVWTTNASPDDPTDGGRPWEGVATTLPFSGPNLIDEKEAVKSAVDIYFTGFTGKAPKQMQAAFAPDAVYLFDFNGARKVPFGCQTDPGGCATAPYFKSRDELLPAFQGFTSPPSFIKLNKSWNVVSVVGDMALVTTRSYGCEGKYVTPDGALAMPNREMFVTVKRGGQWKIKSYMFTFDPAPTLEPPQKICFNSGAIVV